MRYKCASSRNTSFSIHVLEQKGFHALISCRCFFLFFFCFFCFLTFHCVASCGYSSITMIVLVRTSSLVDPVVPVHLTWRMLNVWQSASVPKMSKITSCIVKSATSRQLYWTVNLSYYLLEQVGGFLLDIANPRERFGHFKKL